MSLDLEGFQNLPGLQSKDVTDRVNELVELCLRKEQESHTPNFLILEWGHLYFECKLSSLNVNFTLFDNSGRPLRAKLDATFIESVPKIKIERKNELHSSDITHARIVKMEDTLPQLCKDIYGSYDYYENLARVNDLDQFRRLEPGTELIFPPLEEII